MAVAVEGCCVGFYGVELVDQMFQGRYYLKKNISFCQYRFRNWEIILHIQASHAVKFWIVLERLLEF